MSQSNVSYQSFERQKAALSRHAEKRCQQRGLPISVVPIVIAFGDRSNDGQGGVRYFMNDCAMTKLVRALGRNQQIDSLRGVYVVVDAKDEQVVITVGHRYS